MSQPPPFWTSTGPTYHVYFVNGEGFMFVRQFLNSNDGWVAWRLDEPGGEVFTSLTEAKTYCEVTAKLVCKT